VDAVNFSHYGAIIVTAVSLGILIAFTKVPALMKLKVLPGALVAVVAGTLLNELFILTDSSLIINQEHLVNLPLPTSMDDFFGQFATPIFSGIFNPDVWIVGVTIAVVASIETLLCIEAADNLDPLKRFTDTNRELKAQGIGNILSGMIGGIPMTSVIVRTSANVNSGGRTKVSAITHGIFLMIAVLAIPFILNKIPLASLAAVLIMIGFKLASPAVFKHIWSNGKFQFIPFLVTVVAVVLTDLLKGVAIGLVVSIFFILKGNIKLAYFFKKDDHREGETIRIELAQEVSFLNKAAIKQTIINLPEGSKVVFDASNTVYIDHDVLQLIRNFIDFGAKDKDIAVSLIGFRKAYKLENSTYVTSLEK
jgi:MFS superfamily sulfate permease-like transporter